MLFTKCVELKLQKLNTFTTQLINLPKPHSIELENQNLNPGLLDFLAHDQAPMRRLPEFPYHPFSKPFKDGGTYLLLLGNP